MQFFESRARAWTKFHCAGRAAVLVALSFLLVPSAAVAQTITLSQAYDRMIDREVQYEILDLQADVAKEVTRQALAQRLPRVGLTIQYLYTQQEIVNQDNETFQEGASAYPTTTMTFSVRQPLYDPVRFRQLPLARAEQELVATEAEVARGELSLRLVDAYLDVARAQLALRQSVETIQARTQLERDLRFQLDAGRIELDPVLRAQGDLLEANAIRAERELELSEALFELYRFTGSDVTAVSYDGASVGISDFQALINTFTASRLDGTNPAIQVAKAQVAVAERELAATRGAYQPTVDLSLELEYEQTEGSLFGGGSTVSSTEMAITGDWVIYEGGVRRSRVREAEARLKIANLRLEQARELNQRRYDALVDAIRRSLQAVSTVGSERAAAQRRLAAAIEQERAGRIQPAAAIEARLRRDNLGLQGQIARLRVVQLQAELIALFGALDITALSRDFRGS